MSRKVVFELTSDDPLALLGGVVVLAPVTPQSAVVPNGQIALSPVVKDEVDLAAGAYYLLYTVSGQGGAATVVISTGAQELAKWTVAASQPGVRDYQRFVVP